MAGERGHILVVEDNRMNRLKLSHSVKQQGHTVEQAENGVRALEMLRERPFDVVLLDILMPEMDGYEVLQRMKDDADLKHIPVIVISALDELDSAVRCIEMGAEDYIAKPFNPVFLKARLDASLRRKKLRDLEQAYLQQEVTLRQSEKLATLGRLSAGMAHELNNPAAATKRGAAQLQTIFMRLQQTHLELDQLALYQSQRDTLRALDQTAQERAEQPLLLDSLSRSDREMEVEQYLEDLGLDEQWETASALVNLGFENDTLASLSGRFEKNQLAAVITWLTYTVTMYTLLQEIGLGAERISEIVKALKSYTYLDQAPVQMVDIHEGLDNTLVILRSKLASGINIQRHYDPDLPQIEAYGSELNQVWTNIIDNAIDAVGETGVITLRTSHDEQWVVVDIEDKGPGIPSEIKSRIFDPFFTTKPPGQGSGMGLNISHNIIVQKHGGSLKVFSQPGETCFEVRLPRSNDHLPSSLE